MPIVVLSPHDGRPVKVREQDIGRAVKDREGRVFYVVPKSDGSGYYGCPTRSGSPRFEIKAQEMEAKQNQAKQTGQELSEQQIHDARGKGRSSRGKFVIVFFLLIVLAIIALWAFTVGPLGSYEWRKGPPANQIPLDPPPRSAPEVSPQSRMPWPAHEDNSLINTFHISIHAIPHVSASIRFEMFSPALTGGHHG